MATSGYRFLIELNTTNNCIFIQITMNLLHWLKDTKDNPCRYKHGEKQRFAYEDVDSTRKQLHIDFFGILTRLSFDEKNHLSFKCWVYKYAVDLWILF
jgi:serine/threonine protein phosphatase 1